jgi:ATP-dependent helicase/nuclease subunit A
MMAKQHNHHAAVAAASDAQWQAADPTASVWVAASAGSGKTKVLIDRFVRLLLSGTPASKILCLTYTQAAAAEMIARVTERLSHWAVCAEEALATELVALTRAATLAEQTNNIARARTLFAHILDCPGGLKIKTFHAFAQEILARFPLEAGIVPHFTVLDDAMAETLQAEAWRAVLRDADTAPEQAAAWAYLVQNFALSTVQNLVAQVRRDQQKLARALIRYGDAPQLTAALYAWHALDPATTPEQTVLAACADACLPLAALLRLALLHEAAEKFDTAQTVRNFMAAAPAERVEQLSGYQRIFLTDKAAVRKSILPKGAAKTAPDLVPLLAAEGERILAVLQRCQTIRRVRTTSAVLTLGQAVQAAYTQRKRRAAALDFDDVINHVVALLQTSGVAPWVLWKLDGGLDHIMLDEAQDTSPQQWALLTALTSEFFTGDGVRGLGAALPRTVFVVGDTKQSIYSFQGAAPEKFYAMREAFRQQVQTAGQNFRAVDLTVSFRSVPLVLATVDQIFAPAAMQAGVSLQPITHRSSQDTVAGYVQLCAAYHRCADKLDKAAPWQPPAQYRADNTPLNQLAQRLADDIQQRCAAGMNPGDIMVLVRRRNALVPALVRALKQHKVPVSGVDRMVLRAELCVQDMLALLQFALLPEDDLNLACVLRGPLLGMDEATLERLCVQRGGSLWQAVLADATLAPLHHWLQALLHSADFGTVYDFLAAVLHQPCPMAASGLQAMLARLGADALDPLDELLNRAQSFGLQQIGTLQQFLQQMLTDASDIKRVFKPESGEVRIMTVHAAKGLQAPMVLVPDTCAPPRPQELALLQWDAATALPYYIGGGAETRDALAEALHIQAREAQLQDYRRLLYVALTRAEAELRLYGSYGEKLPSGFTESWYHTIMTELAPHAAEAPELGTTLFAAGVPVVPQHQPVSMLPVPPLPAWAHAPAAPEPSRRVLAPSQLGAGEAEEPHVASLTAPAAQVALQRGRLMHRLLQYLPTVAPAERADAAAHYLAHQARDCTAATRAMLAAEVLHVLAQPATAPLFAPDSRAEVPVLGVVAGQLVSGQLDRLVVRDDVVLVLDYKTNRQPPATAAGIPAAYQQQMQAYRAVLQQLYPNKTVCCFLLWTHTATLMAVPDTSLVLNKAIL